MLNLTQRTPPPKKLVESTYYSIVIDVKWADGYAPKEAYEIIYEICNGNGSTYQHREIFKNDVRNSRTIAFENYLADNGIESLYEFIGKHERLTFAYQEAYNGRKYFNIKERKFLK